MQIEVDGETETMTIDGIKMTFGFIRILTDPDPTMLYKFERRGNYVKVRSHMNLSEFIPGGAIN